MRTFVRELNLAKANLSIRSCELGQEDLTQKPFFAMFYIQIMDVALIA